jgi:MFS family permease
LLDQIGMKRCLLGAGVCFIFGPLLIVTAGHLATGMTVYTIVWLGMLLSGIGWGLTEAAINPLTAQLYPEDTTHRLNVLHAWFPGGIIVGGLVGFFLSATLPWQGIMALVMIPAALTVVIAATTTFPPPLRSETGVSFGEMVGEVFRRPSFFIWFGAMFLTAASELAPGQWIDVALSNRVGMRGILLLVYVNALMFVFRHFAGRLANKISNPGLLWVSSLLAAIGLFMLSQAQTPVTAVLASTVWGLGVCVMWPTMLASVAERYPRGGSWAMGLVGSAGALASFFVLPLLGAMFDKAKIEFAGGPEAFAQLAGAAKLAVEDAAASVSFQRLAILPVILLLVFGFIWLRERGKSRAVLAGEAA